MDWQIVGHKNQTEFLEKALEKGVLAHAYVFAGPDRVGKRTVAMQLAKAMLEMGESEFHPDFFSLNSDNGIKIEQIRDLIYKLSLKPYQAKYKVAIIDHAEEMTTEAANALLKSLEEPKDFTYIFLITSNPNKLPKTILSRSQKITFGPVNLPQEQTEETIRAEKYFDVFSSSDLPERLIAAYEIADLETGEIKKVLEFWINKLEIKLLQNPQKKLARQIKQVLLSRKFLDQNINSKLLLTNLMLNT